MGLSGASYPVMLVLWTANGIFQSFLWSPAARVFSEMIPPSYRKRACANGATTYPIATILTYLFASLLLKFSGWRADFIVSSLIMFAAAAVFWNRMSFYERETEAHGEIEEITLTSVEDAAQGSLLRILVVSGTLLTVLGAVSLGLLRDGIQSWMPTYLDECFSLGASLSVALSIVLPVFNLIGVYISKWIANHFVHNELAGTAGFMAVAGGALAVLCLTGTLERCYLPDAHDPVLDRPGRCQPHDHQSYAYPLWRHWAGLVGHRRIQQRMLPGLCPVLLRHRFCLRALGLDGSHGLPSGLCRADACDLAYRGAPLGKIPSSDLSPSRPPKFY